MRISAKENIVRKPVHIAKQFNDNYRVKFPNRSGPAWELELSSGTYIG